MYNGKFDYSAILVATVYIQKRAIINTLHTYNKTNTAGQYNNVLTISKHNINTKHYLRDLKLNQCGMCETKR